MKEIAASKFKINCLAVVEQVRKTRKPVNHHAVREAGGGASAGGCSAEAEIPTGPDGGYYGNPGRYRFSSVRRRRMGHVAR